MTRMPEILVVVHSGEGQSRRIADRIADVLRDRGAEVTVAEPDVAPEPRGFDAVVAGDSIHLGRHSKALRRWLVEHTVALAQAPLALFQVSLTSATHDDDHDVLARKMLADLVDETGVRPDEVALFAGRLAYTQYRWLTRRIMRSIARREGQDTDTSRDHEYTDWSAVDRFAEVVARRARLDSRTSR
jgi:menaquinone-dependent protoporphyrinogen oxidase